MAVELASLATTSHSNTTLLTITKPSGLAVGDLMICHYEHTDTVDTIQTLSGWTHEVANVNIGTTYTGLQWKVADSSDVAASQFQWNATGTMRVAGALLRITGYSSSDLLNDNRATVSNSNSPSFANTVTPGSTDSLMLMFLVAGSLGGGTPPTFASYAIATDNPTWTEQYDIVDGTTSELALATAPRSAATATGNSSVTIGNDGATDSLCILVSIPVSVDATASVSSLTLTATITTPVAIGSANATTTSLSLTATINTLTVSTPTPSVVNRSKNSASAVNRSKNV